MLVMCGMFNCAHIVLIVCKYIVVQIECAAINLFNIADRLINTTLGTCMVNMKVIPDIGMTPAGDRTVPHLFFHNGAE